MYQRVFTAIVIGLFVISICACGTIPEQHKGAAVGAGTGAAAGTAAGAIIGEDAEGAVVGGLLGALLGGALGHYAYDRRRDRDETARTYDYSSSQGNVLSIENVSITPQKARQGEVVELDMTYAVLTPGQSAQTSITETRTITYQGNLVGEPSKRVQRTDGTYASSWPLHLPEQARPGSYRVNFKVETGFGSDIRTATFEVM